MSKKQKLIAVVGPSGTGKSVLVRGLTNLSENLVELISSTTRDMRVGEIKDKDYYFLKKEEFLKREMVESVLFAGLHYGLQKSEFDRVPENKDMLIVVEPNGALEIAKYIKENDLDIEMLMIYMNIPSAVVVRNLETEFLKKDLKELAKLENKKDLNELEKLKNKEDIKAKKDIISNKRLELKERVSRGNIDSDLKDLLPEMKKFGLSISQTVKVLNDRTTSSVYEWYTFYRIMYT